MKRNSMYIPVTMVLLGVSVIGIGCGMVIVESVWMSEPVMIDGIDTDQEWEHAKYYFEDEQVTVGLKNDDAALCVFIACGNEDIQRQIFTGGFTLWIDPAGDEDKLLGIRHPVGMQGGQPRMGGGLPAPGADQADRRLPEGGSRGGRFRQPGTESGDLSDLGMQLARIPRYLELIGFDMVDSTRVSCEDVSAMGIAVALGYAPGVLVYEIRLPLHDTLGEPLALGVEGDALSLCLETEALRMQQGGPGGGGGRGGRGGSMGGGPGGGMGGGRGGGMGGPGGGMRQAAQMDDPIERWVNVELATLE